MYVSVSIPVSRCVCGLVDDVVDEAGAAAESSSSGVVVVVVSQPKPGSDPALTSWTNSGTTTLAPTGTGKGTECVNTGELGASGTKGSSSFTKCAGELGRVGPTPTGEVLRVASAEHGRGSGRGE